MAFNLMPLAGPPVQFSKMDRSFSQPGVYFLWQGDAIVYVGQSRNMTQRILQHVGDRLKQFDGVSCRPCGVRELVKSERAFIEAFLPKYNRCGATEAIRKIWVGHMDERPTTNKGVGAGIAAQVLGVTAEQLVMLNSQGLPYRRVRMPRSNVRRTFYHLRDLHQFAAQKADRIIAVRARTSK